MIVIIIVLILVSIFTVILSFNCSKDIYYKLQNDWLQNEFRRCNCIVYGKKRTGKDLLFAHVIFLRNEKHYSNIFYDKKTEVIGLLEVSLGNNSFIDVINDKIKKVECRFERYSDIYISDAGINLPAQCHMDLQKTYPSMPMMYGLSGNIFDINIHMNTQALSRPWDKLREQADSYIWVLGNTEFKDYFIVNTIYYDRYDSALNCLLPCNKKEYKAKYGVIKRRNFKIYKSELKYDTHYFRSKFIIESEDDCPLFRG